MFIPIYDGKPVQFISLHWVTLTLIVFNCVIFAMAAPFAPADGTAGAVSIGFGHVPSVANDLRVLPDQFRYIPEGAYFVTAITYSFIHLDIWHLGGNMLFLWVFGDNVEDALGHFKYLVFYFACAFAAATFHALVFPDSDSPLIGASGAAAGIVAAYLMLHPRMKIWVLFLARIPLRLSAFWLLGAWIAFQIYMFVTDYGTAVSWAAHIGGILAGLVLVVPLKRREVALFDRDLAVADAPEPDPPKPDPPRWGRT